MTRFNTPPLRLRADGSIDTAFYMARGRRHRSETAHRLLGATPAQPERPRRGWLATLLPIGS